MGLWGSIFKAIAGAAEVTVGALIEVGTLGGGTPLAVSLIATGAMNMATGIYGAVSNGGNGKQKNSTAVRDAISPWNVIYGQIIHGGATVYMNTWGNDTPQNFGKPTSGPAVPIMLDIVNIMACHKCKSMDKVYFERKMLQLNTTWIPTNAKAGYSLIRQPDAGAGTSFSPLNNGQTATGISHITRGYDPSGGFDSPGLVVVTLNSGQSIPYLSAGDQITIEQITGDRTLNGTYQVAQILAQSSPGFTTKFSYLNGGNPAVVDNEGSAVTNWADYSWTAYVEPILGTQTLGQTFAGMSAGTTWQGNGKLVSPISPGPAGGTAYTSQNGGGPWLNTCSLVGMTAFMTRLMFDSGYHQSGVPQISYLISGKSDIFDPRLSGGAGGYAWTANAALCIADFLANPVWGYGAAYGTEIPLGPLTDAANICDQQVSVVRGGTENCYECHGTFDLNQTRGEILADLLTSCGARLIYVNGQYIIIPATPPGSSGYYMYSGAGHIASAAPLTPAYDLQAHALGAPEWKPTVSIRDLYNGVKGVYISADNNYQSSDIPPYMQDTDHGYPGTPYADINLAVDGLQRRFLNIRLPFTTSSSMAQRLAKIELLRRRWSANSALPGLQGRGSGTFVCDCSAYQFVPTDIITVNCAFFGWTNKVVEVVAVRLKSTNDLALFVELDLIEVDSSIYAWTTSEELNPQGYQQSSFPKQTFVESVPLPWSPGYVSPLAGDVHEGAAASFGVQPVYGADASENPTVNLQISGYAPLNNLDQDISSPLISCVGSGSGSSLPAGDYVVGLSSRSASSLPFSNSEYLDIATVTITAGQQIVVTITWQPGDSGGDLYMASYADSGNYVFHHQQNVAANAATATITSFDQTTPGGPDDRFDHFAISFQQVVHSGDFAAQIVSVTATTVTLNSPGMTTNLWAGYTLSLLAKYSATAQVPILNMPVASNTASDGSNNFVLTIGVNGLGHQLPDLTTLLATFDLVVMRAHATFTASSFTDANIANPFYPGGATGVEAGHVAVVMTGPDAGDVQTISSVSGGTTFKLGANWTIQPNTGDIVIICAPSNLPEVPGSSLSVTNALSSKILQPSIPNLANTIYLFKIRTEDANGNHGSDVYAPMREVFLFGSIANATTPNALPYAPNGGGQYPVFDDALVAQAKFGLTATSETLADAILAGAQITPIPNPNLASTLIDTPLLSPGVTYASTGGSIPGGTSGFLAIASKDSAGAFTELSNIVAFSVPTGTDTNTLTFIPTYDPASASILIYTGGAEESLSYRSSSSPSSTVTMTTLVSSTGDAYPIPDSQFVNFVAGWTKVLLAGSFGGTAATVSSIEAKTSLGGSSWQLALSGAAFTPSALIGRILSWISQGVGNPTPLQDYVITANDATTVTVSGPTSGGYAAPVFDVGDIVYIPLKATTYTGTVIGDAMLAMTADQYKGSVLRVFYPDGTNQTAFITTNDATTCTVDSNFTGPTPLFWWIEAGSFGSMIPSKPTKASTYEPLGLSFFVPFDNVAAFNAVQVFAQDGFNNLSPAAYSPIRLLWWPGAAASVADSAPPPQPAFTADASIPGSIHFSAINFAGATLNLETVSTLQFGVYYEVPLHSGVTPMSLTVDIGTGDTSLTISHDTTDITGSFILIDAEVIALTARTSFTDVGGVPKGTYNCTRGIRGSTAAAHTATTTITILACQTLFYQFVSGFWNPGLGVAWQTWQATEALPNTLIAFIDLVAINALGVSPLDTNNYLPGGLATGTAAMTATDPISYGAAANGTTDDSVPISSAIAAGGLFLQPGRTYAYTWAGISAAMATVVDGFTITGGGILKLLSGSTPALTFAGSVVVRIIGVTIDGNSATGTQPLILLNSGSKICLYIVMAIGQGSNPTVGLSGGSTALSYNASGCVGIPDNTGAF